MGDPVSIVDVATRLIAQADRRVRIDYTGLRLGEKLHEKLLGNGEVDRRPTHELISQVPVPPLAPEVVRRLRLDWPNELLNSELEALCRREMGISITDGEHPAPGSEYADERH
jgi:FlaA1/EpsC-like NDP-sugar epimerase